MAFPIPINRSPPKQITTYTDLKTTMSSETTSSAPPQKSWLNKLASAFGGNDPQNSSELMEMLRESHQRQLIDNEAMAIIEGAMQVADMQVREVMIPRTQMVVVKADQKPDEYLPLIIESAHSRFPVAGEDPDDILGILLAKDLLTLLIENKLDRTQIRGLLRPAIKVPESKRLNVLLKEFRDTRNHMAIVVNEYGGVAGLITIEDVLEQIVGEIEDEHDSQLDDHLIKKSEDGSHIVKAGIPVEEFNEYFKTDFDEEEFDTIGGIVIKEFGHLPKRNESVDIGNLHFTVLNASNRTIHLLQVLQA